MARQPIGSLIADGRCDDEIAAKPQHVPDPGEGHRHRAPHAPRASFAGVSLPTAFEKAPWTAGYRAPEVPSSNLRQWLLLAFARVPSEQASEDES